MGGFERSGNPGCVAEGVYDQRAYDGPDVEVTQRPCPRGSESPAEDVKLSRTTEQHRQPTRKPSVCEWSRAS